MSQTDRLYGLVPGAAIKVPCLAASTANLTLTAEQTIDGVACVTGDRVLVKDQTDETENGIWVVDTGDWNRAKDFDGAFDVVRGTILTVLTGTVNASTAWRVTSTDPVDVGSDDITFEPGLFNDAAVIYFIAAGTGAVQRTVQDKMRESVSALDFIPAALHASILDRTNTTDLSTYIQTANDAASDGYALYFPRGRYRFGVATLYLKRDAMTWYGDGMNATELEFYNAAGGTGIAGHVTNTSVISWCDIRDMALISSGAGTDPDKYIDMTTMSYSHIDLTIQTKRANAAAIYGEGNSGSSPYYNHIEGALFGNSSTQTGICFAAGAWSGGSNGPNGNIIGPIRRAAALDIAIDIQAGNGNMISNVNAESIGTAHVRLNYQAAATETGTSSGSNTMDVLNDSSKSWSTNAYVNYGVKITAGTGSGQVRIVGSNTGTQLVLKQAWGVLPDNTSTYSLFKGVGTATKISNYRGEGSSGADFIAAYPGTQQNYVAGAYIDSLGAGLYVRDDSGALDNTWYDGAKTAITFNVQNPGTSANIDLLMKSGVFGGFRPAGGYVVESLEVATSTATLGDTATVKLDVGGATPGAGDMTLTVEIPTGNAGGIAIPASTEKIRRDSTDDGLFINVATGGSFSATADLQVTAVITIGV